MIKTIIGNALDAENCIIVHGCNAQGVMGAGIALEVKNRFPIAFDTYRKKYFEDGLHLGEISFVKVAENKIIINAITQDFYNTKGSTGRQVSYDAVDQCFHRVVEVANAYKDITGTTLDIVFPMIGAGLGGGKWNIIEQIIDQAVPNAYNKFLYILK